MSDGIKETPVTNWPGWTKIRYPSNNVEYRHNATGIVLSNAKFFKLTAQYKGMEYIPEESIRMYGQKLLPSPSGRVVNSTATVIEDEYEQLPPVQTTTQPQFSNTPPRPSSMPGSRPNPHVSQASASRAAAGPHLNQAPPPPHQPTTQEPPTLDDTFSVLEPKPHVSRGRPSGNKATAKELADGLYITMTILSGVFAVLSGLDVGMRDIEARNIAIPSGNLLEPTKLNEKFGRMIAQSGDWQLLGYAVFLYVQRVGSSIQESRGGEPLFDISRLWGGQRQQQQVQQQQSAPSYQNGYNPAVNGAALPRSNAAPRDLRDMR